ncbi:MAG TPA: DEAD/DEAH box helicase, partial [Gammaproteobacteria bacterium]|nr:DEAD/DEAH box helicase [Gammaproteobacteria bacterium]
MSFSQFNFNPHIFKAIDMCGYKNPTPIQTQSIPGILNGNDVVATSQTGSGKTAAFVLPALQRLSMTKSGKQPRILILTPTRELATQIKDAADKYGKFLQFKLVSLVGGMPYRQQLKGLSGHVDMIVATPGRLMDHMENRRLDLSQIEMLVLDEADRMLDMGFIDDVKHIAKATPHDRQTLLFSATVNDKLGNIIQQLLKNPTRIDLSHEKIIPNEIKQELYIADHVGHKMRLLHHFLYELQIFKGIIFTATKIHCDKLAKELCDKGLNALPLHGDLKQNVRNRTIEKLRRGKIQYLVATDVAARGLDVQDVSHVFNFDLPKFSEDYVHRIGRTGRAGKKGLAISLALCTEGRHVQKIERYMGKTISIATVEGLEPTKNLNSAPSAKRKKRKPNFKKGAGFKKEGFGSKREGSGFNKEGFGSKREGSSFKKEGFGSKREGSGFKKERSGSKREDSGFKKEGFGSKREGSGFNKEGFGSKR